MLNALLDWLNRTSLVLQIVIALVAGVLVAWLWPTAAQPASMLGTLFISALKAVAPVLVFVLVIAAIGNHRPGQQTQIKPVLWLYVLGTLAAACVGVAASVLFPSVIHFREAPVTQGVPGEISQVLMNVVHSAVDNPVRALMEANYIGVLAWAIALGTALRHASQSTRTMIEDLGKALTRVIQGVIRLAPLGIFGLVVATFS
ncbi:MAG: cation:dicarboxylase symporter family transporter, partial [Comamonas sp.]